MLHKNRVGGVAQGEGPEFKPQYCKKKKKSSCQERSSLLPLDDFTIRLNYIGYDGKYIAQLISC
jgi:hypothetical protein